MFNIVVDYVFDRVYVIFIDGVGGVGVVIDYKIGIVVDVWDKSFV